MTLYKRCVEKNLIDDRLQMSSFYNDLDNKSSWISYHKSMINSNKNTFEENNRPQIASQTLTDPQSFASSNISNTISNATIAINPSATRNKQLVGSLNRQDTQSYVEDDSQMDMNEAINHRQSPSSGSENDSGSEQDEGESFTFKAKLLLGFLVLVIASLLCTSLVISLKDHYNHRSAQFGTEEGRDPALLPDLLSCLGRQCQQPGNIFLHGLTESKWVRLPESLAQTLAQLKSCFSARCQQF